MKIKLLLIRHGATPLNECGGYLGRTEESLSENGREQLRDRKEDGWYQQPEFIAASPMKRCLETAELIYGVAKPMVLPELREIDFGRFEGKNYLQLQEDAAYQSWVDSGGMLPFPEGESREQFIERCMDGFEQFCHKLKQMQQVPDCAALVVHGGTIMAILSTCLQQEYFKFSCKNAEGYSCEVELDNPCQLYELKKLGEEVG